jgi:hypothetical protein
VSGIPVYRWAHIGGECRGSRKPRNQQDKEPLFDTVDTHAATPRNMAEGSICRS